MSLYTVQKLIRDVNRSSQAREAWFASRSDFLEQYDLTEAEIKAFQEMNISILYKMGVHGLLLRPFTIIHQVSEADYLQAIRS